MAPGVQWMPFRRPRHDEEAEFVLRRKGHKRYVLENRFRYVEPGSAGRTWVVPRRLRRFETDLASVPQPVTWLVPKDGRHTPAALLHDAMVSGGERAYLGPSVDRIEADKVFRQAMQHLGVAFLRRWVMWGAVCVGTAAAGRPHRTGLWAKAWRVMRCLVVLAFLLAVASFGLCMWADMMDRSWAVLPKLDGSGPRLPWMGRSGPDWPWIGTNASGEFWIEAKGAVALTLAGSCLVGAFFAVIRLLGEVAASVAQSTFERPQMRALAFSVSALALIVFALPLALAGVGWIVYHLAELLLARVVLPATRRGFTVLKNVLDPQSGSALDQRLDLLTGPIADLPILPLHTSPREGFEG